MSKTPEEMAEEWAKQEVPQYHHIDCTPMDRYAHKKAERGFLAGYKAAQDQIADEIAAIRESWSASKVNELIYENAQLTAELSTIRNK